MEAKRLRRSLKDSVIGGVSGGLGEYFGTDPVIFRILFVVLTFTGGGGVLIYLLMWIFIPKAEVDFRGQQFNNQNNTKESNEQDETIFDEANQQEPYTEKDAEEEDPKIIERRKNGNFIGGALLIMIGMFFLADDFFPWLSWHYLWPAALIIAGLAIIKVNYKSKND